VQNPHISRICRFHFEDCTISIYAAISRPQRLQGVPIPSVGVQASGQCSVVVSVVVCATVPLREIRILHCDWQFARRRRCRAQVLGSRRSARCAYRTSNGRCERSWFRRETSHASVQLRGCRWTRAPVVRQTIDTPPVTRSCSINESPAGSTFRTDSATRASRTAMEQSALSSSDVHEARMRASSFVQQQQQQRQFCQQSRPDLVGTSQRRWIVWTGRGGSSSESASGSDCSSSGGAICPRINE
jgi:hypothetical protein